MTGAARVLGTAVGSALGARVLWRAAQVAPPGGPATWARTNHRGEPVTLLAGPVVAAAVTGTAVLAGGRGSGALAAAAGLATGASGIVGTYDDLAGTPGHRGLRGHLTALRHGAVSSGAVKVATIGTAGLLAGALLRRRPAERLLAGVVVAGSANLVNLLDLRPGRAGKACLLGAGPGLAARLATGRLAAPDVVTAAALGAAVALLPEDLAERAMLGDAGANALGAALGVAAAARASRSGLAAIAAALVAMTLASERVSFTRVIAAVPPLHALDRLGRRPA